MRKRLNINLSSIWKKQGIQFNLQQRSFYKSKNLLGRRFSRWKGIWHKEWPKLVGSQVCSYALRYICIWYLQRPNILLWTEWPMAICSGWSTRYRPWYLNTNKCPPPHQHKKVRILIILHKMQLHRNWVNSILVFCNIYSRGIHLWYISLLCEFFPVVYSLSWKQLDKSKCPYLFQQNRNFINIVDTN